MNPTYPINLNSGQLEQNEAFTNMLVSLLKSFFILLKNIKKIKIATSRLVGIQQKLQSFDTIIRLVEKRAEIFIAKILRRAKLMSREGTLRRSVLDHCCGPRRVPRTKFHAINYLQVVL